MEPHKNCHFHSTVLPALSDIFMIIQLFGIILLIGLTALIILITGKYTLSVRNVFISLFGSITGALIAYLLLYVFRIVTGVPVSLILIASLFLLLILGVSLGGYICLKYFGKIRSEHLTRSSKQTSGN